MITDIARGDTVTLRAVVRHRISRAVSLQTAKRKPPGTVYAVDEAPPLVATFLNGVQHVGLIAIFLVFPLLVFRVAGLPQLLVANLLAIAMIVLGIGTLLQSLRLGPMGSGYLCPVTFTAAYLSPSLLAMKAGGLPLLFGMTLFAGALEAAFSRLLDRVRPIFPPEITGLVIFMVGWGAGVAALRTMLDSDAPPLEDDEFWISVITLSTMTALNVWTRGMARMLCALIGVVAGYFASALAGLFGGPQLAMVASAPWIGLPTFDHLSWSFDGALAMPFAIAALAVAMKVVGTMTMCQRMNDADWVRIDMRSAQRGVLADGAGTMIAGALGTIGAASSAACVGVAAATGVASRRVAYATGLVLLALGLTPKLAAVLAIMPRAVMVAALLFGVAFIVINGLQVMASRLLDGRRTLVIGLSIVAGGAAEVFPQLARVAPAPFDALAGSSVAFATVVALALNLAFRIGSKRTVNLTIEHGTVDPGRVEAFFEQAGATWGARPHVVRRATFAVIQLLDAVGETCWQRGPIEVSASFDEFNLDVRVSYEGELLEFPEQRPSTREIVESENGARRLAGFMLRRCAERIGSQAKDGTATVFLHYDH
jgi:NCS2 family nucleobase:cation symporter-2